MKIKILFLNQKKSGNRKRMSTNPLQSVFFLNKLGFTPWKAELLQQDMELNRKKKEYRKDFYREPKEKNASIKT